MNRTRRLMTAALATGGWGIAAAQGSAGTAALPTAGEDAARETRALALPAAGTRLALPAAELLDGRRFDPAQAEDRVIVLYWWASWCPFCAVVSPEVEKLWRAQRGRGLQMLTLSIDRRAEDASEYLRRRGYTFPAAWVSPQLHRALPKPKGLPVTMVRGRDGRVLQAEAGQLFPEDVEALARHLS